MSIEITNTLRDYLHRQQHRFPSEPRHVKIRGHPRRTEQPEWAIGPVEHAQGLQPQRQEQQRREGLCGQHNAELPLLDGRLGRAPDDRLTRRNAIAQIAREFLTVRHIAPTITASEKAGQAAIVGCCV